MEERNVQLPAGWNALPGTSGLALGNFRFWCQRVDARFGSPSQSNQVLFVVKDKLRKPSGELGVNKSIECDNLLPSAIVL